MAIWLPKPPPPAPPCHCKRGRYPQPDVYSRTWWWQITSDCPTHFPPLQLDVKLRILRNELHDLFTEEIHSA